MTLFQTRTGSTGHSDAAWLEGMLVGDSSFKPERAPQAIPTNAHRIK